MLENKCPIGVFYGAFQTGISCMCKHMFAQGFKVSLRSASHRPCEHFFPAFIFLNASGFPPKSSADSFLPSACSPPSLRIQPPNWKKKCFSVVSCVADLNPCVGKCRYYNTDLIFFPLAQGHGWVCVSLSWLTIVLSHQPPTIFWRTPWTWEQFFPNHRVKANAHSKGSNKLPITSYCCALVLPASISDRPFLLALPFGDRFRYVSCIF